MWRRREGIIVNQSQFAHIYKFFFFARACAIFKATRLWATVFVFVGGICSTGLIAEDKKQHRTPTLKEIRTARTSEKNPLKRHRLNQDIIRSQEPGISDTLLESLKTDTDPMVQTGAAQELGNYVQNPGVVDALIAALKTNPSNSVRMAVARSLSLSKSPAAAAALSQAADDQDPFVRKQVAFGLKKHNTKESKAALKKLKRDGNKQVREMAGGKS